MEKLQHIREKQKKRRELLAKQLGVESGEKLATVLNSKDTRKNQTVKRHVPKPPDDSDKELKVKINKIEQVKQSANTSQDIREIESESDDVNVYKDSSTFLKGTQSLNPHNDYCQNYVDTGQRPQNFIRDVGLAERFGEYPKLKDLIRLKDDLIRKTNTPPTYLKCDLKKFNLKELGCKFDVILIDPPLVEYKKQAGLPLNGSEATWEDVISMKIEEVAGSRSFVFLWCGSSDGLDNGRKCLSKWGFRRCEDICWIKTNIKRNTPHLADESLLVRTKEHCLMGIKGTVRRSTDGDFIHANVDIDLIIDEEEEPGSCEKPEEIFHLIEHFCLGRRRLHLFGRDTSIRPGWLTVGPQLTNSNFDRETYANHFKVSDDNPVGPLSGCTEEIERLRPKTPPPREKKSERGGLTGGPVRGIRGRGAISGRRGDHQSSRSERGAASPISTTTRTGMTSTLPAAGSSYPQFHEPRETGSSAIYRNENRNHSASHKRDSSRDRSTWRDYGRGASHRSSRTSERSTYQSR